MTKMKDKLSVKEYEDPLGVASNTYPFKGTVTSQWLCGLNVGESQRL